MSQSMKIIIGAPATGSNFYPRQRNIDNLLNAMAAEHVLFLAPRRTGKTSILLNLQKSSAANCLFINLEEFNHPEQFINELFAKLTAIQDPIWLQKLNQLHDFLPRLKTKYGQIEKADWQEKANALMDDLTRLNTPVWFLLDEFPTMVDLIAKRHGVELAEQALHWVRKSRQNNIDSPVRFLLTGSIGLDSVLRRHGIRGVANDLRREWLKPLSENEAVEMALKLALDNNLALSKDLAMDYVLRLGLARWPYFIQLFMAELQQTEHPINSPADIEKIYHNIAISRRNQYAENMVSRLSEIFTPEEKHFANQVLSLAAKNPNGVSYEQLRSVNSNIVELDFTYVLDVLQHDGYLIETEQGKISFFSNLLLDYWLRKLRS